jgi:hypothetical protein
VRLPFNYRLLTGLPWPAIENGLFKNVRVNAGYVRALGLNP